MKVKDLIALLKMEDPEKMVIVSGYEGGYSDISSVEHKRILLNVNKSWYFGPHEEDFNGDAAILIK